jgi:hypothetical protein
MTPLNQKLIGLDEIIGIQYECTQCHVKISFPRKANKWKKVPTICPHGCTTGHGGVDVLFGEDGIERKNVQFLVNAITAILAIEPSAIGCSIKLELQEEEK